VYVTHVVTREFIDIIKTDVPVPGTAIAELSQMRFYCENAEADRLREMQLARLRVMKIDKSRIKKGLDLLKSRMIYINATCVWAAKEFSSYSYQKDSQGTVIDIPNDRDNHTIDATRYAVFSNSRSTMQLF